MCELSFHPLNLCKGVAAGMHEGLPSLWTNTDHRRFILWLSAIPSQSELDIGLKLKLSVP